MILSASSDHTLRLWDVESGQALRRFSGHTGGVWGCAFSPDGRLILSASADRTLRLWDVESGAERTRWLTDVAIYCCAFSPHGRRILAGDSAGGMHILELVSTPPAAPALEPLQTMLSGAPLARMGAGDELPRRQRNGWWPFQRR
jgi:WD40 repeat protein